MSITKVYDVDHNLIFTEGMWTTTEKYNIPRIQDNSDEHIVVISEQLNLLRQYQEKNIAVIALLTKQNKAESFQGIAYAVQKISDVDETYAEQVYRRFHGLPWDILETERCLVRETTVEDVDAFYDLYKDPEITRYMENLFEDPEEEKEYARNYIRCVYSFYGFGTWTIVQKETGAVIGRAGITLRDGFETPELGYMIGKAYQRQGYAGEVCEAILQYGLKEFDFYQIGVFTNHENEASQALCRRLGFRFQSREIIGGEELDYLIWSACDEA